MAKGKTQDGNTHPIVEPAQHLSRPKYRADIDGLRAIAVLSVVGFHAFPSWVQGGFVGVDVFFTISGFLISTIIFQSLDCRAFSLIEFYDHRIRRIFPALLLILVTSYSFGWFVLFADEFKQLGKNIATGAGFVSNYLLWRESGYFDSATETNPLLHLWSLSIEEQFYIVWPLLLWVAWKKRFNLLTITVCVAVVSFALNIKEIRSNPIAAFYSPQTRFWELLAGSMLAWSSLYKKHILPKLESKIDHWFGININVHICVSDGHMLRNAQSAVGLVMILATVVGINKDYQFPGWWALLPVLGAVMIISAGTQAWVNRILLCNKVLVWFGLISYPLYLWHWPLLSFMRLVGGEAPTIKLRVAAVVSAVILAWLTYRFIERPIRYGVKPKQTTGFLLLIVALMGYVGFNTFARDGLPHRRGLVKTIVENSDAFSWSQNKYHSKTCLDFTGTNGDYCLISSKTPTVALIGDSHANAIYEFFAAQFGQSNQGVIMLGQGGCPPFLGVERNKAGCPKIMSEIVNYLVANPDIVDVFITGRFAATESGINFGGKTVDEFYALTLLADAGEKRRSVIFRVGLENLLKALITSGKRVTLILDVPELDFDPKTCLKARGLENCSIDAKTVARRQENYTSIIGDLKVHYQFRVIDLKSAFCDDTKCRASDDALILYRDTHHLGVFGNSFLLKSGLKLN